MSIEKYRQLTDLLIVKTEEGRLEWEDTIGDDVYQVTFGPNTIQISEEINRKSGATDYVIRVINRNGTVIDGFSDNEIEMHDEDGNPYYYPRLRSIFTKIARKISGADDVLNDIIIRLAGDL